MEILLLCWAKHEEERLNPQNGICLSPLYDTYFDRAFIGIDDDYKIHLLNFFKEKISKPYFEKSFEDLDGRKINLPQKFLPKKEFLEVQFSIFAKQNF